MARVLVVGSLNVDVVVRVSRRPAPGETVLADSTELRSGGKGANQAVAAARAGAHTTMLGAVGSDAWGRDQVDALRAAGVLTDAIAVLAERGTGFATITVTPDGENSIVVAAGANALVTPEMVDAARGEHVDVFVAQTEIPVDAVDAAAVLAGRLGARFVLNTAPVVAVAAQTLRSADPLVVNEHEAIELLELLGVPAPPGAKVATELLRHAGARSLVVTLGGRGALVLGDAPVTLDAPQVAVVDTTGAGDVFVGTLAAELARGADLLDAAAAAILAASHAVTTPGAR